ncbi:GPI2-domain-containing protein [Annulohypoxylon truncatum]|uniref:GPI2-domain-containing protein n=1 Tax=Annulohypoxylon truncatum TaxID=327061 RepID=UPI002008E621|nr:GPI2-domain-containing protein [Annulohypoxylon truncatum]KAI1212720.1 GPI2-domain-containing protein [Annulohypoxylon truncatum]
MSTSSLGSSATTATSKPTRDGPSPPSPPPQPGLTRAATLPIELHSPRSARSHLAPEDAFNTAPPLRRQSGFEPNNTRGESRSRKMNSKLGSRSRSRRRRRNWKKLLWVKQSYPDNYTDQATFLENLQRNPRLQPYEFWPLVADSTVILQQVCSVTIFVVCFVGIFQDRVSPVAVVGWGSFATFMGWLLWDWWVGQEDEDEALQRRRSNRSRSTREQSRRGRSNIAGGGTQSAASSVTNLAAMERTYPQGSLVVTRQSHSASASSLQSNASQGRRSSESIEVPTHRPSSPLRNGRANLRLSTIKSAILIYFTLLGLSPILKSLTRSTSSDSIWAMSFWLLAMNIFFYDYSSGPVKFPASLSTNAALMASTVLASRLPSTGQVFSLTLFSIEVFGLFPVFRRYARHRSWRYHVVLSVLLVIGAGGGVGLILSGEKDDVWPWKSGLLGVLVASFVAVVAMGGCSWWLIGLQKYKNAINGPWDQARPIIISRRLWDDE